MRILLLFCGFFSASLLFSQPLTLNGRVVDERKLSLPGATVRLNDTKMVFQSGKHGEFSIQLPDTVGVLLQVSYVGYQEKRVDLSRTGVADTLIIQLTPEVQQLSEVQIRDRHAELRKREETRSLEVVETSYIRQHLSGSLMQTLERLPGVSAVEIGSGQSKPLIRGLGFNRVVVSDHGVKHEAQQWGADHGLEIDQFSVDQIEVIKGPASLRPSEGQAGEVQFHFFFRTIMPDPAFLPMRMGSCRLIPIRRTIFRSGMSKSPSNG